MEYYRVTIGETVVWEGESRDKAETIYHFAKDFVSFGWVGDGMRGARVKLQAKDGWHTVVQSF